MSAEGYTHAAAFDTGYLQVSNLHRIYYEQYGKPDGKPGNSPIHPTKPQSPNKTK